MRDWLNVSDHCQAIWRAYTKGKAGEIYNIGGNNERTNLEIIRFILDYLHKPYSLISHVEDRLGHDRRYAVDATKAKIELGWEPIVPFEHGIRHALDWYAGKV